MIMSRRTNSRRSNRRRSGAGRRPPLFRPLLNQEYIVDLSVQNNVNSNGSGVAAGVIHFDPTITYNSTPFTEWTNLGAMFNSIKLISFEVQFVRMVESVTEAKGIYPMMIASVPIGTPSTPSDYATVSDNADAKVWGFLNDTSPRGYTHRYVARRGRIYAPTVTPAPTSGIDAGCNGGIIFYTQGMDASTPAFFLMIRGRYALYGRI